jgi:glycosyltransferase involved in cell wall biosynthesis
MTTDAVGGVWFYATTLARALCRDGMRVHLVTLGPPPRPDQLRPLRSVPGLHVEVTGLELEWLDPEGHGFDRAATVLSAIEQRVKPDLVHLNGYREANIGWIAPVLVVAHSCVRSWWHACRGSEPSEPRWRSYIAHVRSALAAADVWAAPSAAFRDTIAQLYAPPGRGQVIHNGIEDFWQPATKEPFILAAGRLWDEAKNLFALAAVADRLDWPLRIAGPLRAPDSAPAPREVPACVRILGELPRQQLLAQLGAAEIFAAPALYEPFGLTILEAATAGCALLLSDIGSLRELWQGCAMFVDPRDPAAIGAALDLLCHDAKLRRDLQAAARQRAARYSLEATADGYHSLYARMVGGTRFGRERPARAELHA